MSFSLKCCLNRLFIKILCNLGGEDEAGNKMRTGELSSCEIL